MTKRERALINAALKWCAAEHAPREKHQDNPADGALRDAMIAATFEVMHERERRMEHYFRLQELL